MYTIVMQHLLNTVLEKEYFYWGRRKMQFFYNILLL